MNWRKGICTMGIAVILAFSSSARSFADVVLSTEAWAPPGISASNPHSSDSEEDDEFPESQFGAAPSRPKLAESLIPSPNGIVRKPAGLEFSNSPPKIQNAASKIPIAGSEMVQEVALIAGDLGFFPKTIVATRDIPVRVYVTGASKKTLCFMLDAFQIRRQIRSQKIEEISFIPSSAGKYRFYCPVNGTEGAILVKEAAIQKVGE